MAKLSGQPSRACKKHSSKGSSRQGVSARHLTRTLPLFILAGLLTELASAQSSVTVYGVVDLAARRVQNNSGSGNSLVPSSNSSSRLGFRGTEDLGGGLKAKFLIETDLNPDTGLAGPGNGAAVPTGLFWTRGSWVGLSGSFGEVRLGRDFTPAIFVAGSYNPFGYIGAASQSNFYSQSQLSTLNAAFGPSATTVTTLVKVNNAIQWFTPTILGGLYAHVMVATPEGSPSSGTSGNSKYWSGRVTYEAGPVSVGAAFARTMNTAIAGHSLDEATMGASYDFGVVKLSGLYTQLKYVEAKSAIWNVGAQVPIGLGAIKAVYIKADQSGVAPAVLGTTPAGGSIADRDASLVGLGYEYYLSKRTSMYAQAARISNKGQSAAFAESGGPAFTPGSDRKSTAYEMGIRHSF